MFPILWGLLQSIVFTVFSNAGGVLLSFKNILFIYIYFVLIGFDGNLKYFIKFLNKLNYSFI